MIKIELQEKIRTWIRQGHRNVDIAERTGYSESYISKLRKKVLERHNAPEKVLWIRYLDHCVMSNGYETFRPAEQACIGVVERETDEAYWIRVQWSISLDKTITSVQVIKDAIKEIVEYVPSGIEVKKR